MTMVASGMSSRVEQHHLNLPVVSDQDIYNRIIITLTLVLVVESATRGWVSEIKVIVPAETIDISGRDGRVVIALAQNTD